MVSFFHAYDLRGTYPDEISEEEAEKVGKAFGTYIDSEKAIVGRDGRKHSPSVKKAFVKGLVSTGTEVLDAGMIPSPVVYYGSKINNVPSIVITASHNPPEYTGFKFSKKGAVAMSREGGMKQIEDIYEAEEFKSGEASVNEVELKDDYIEFVEERVNLERELKVAVNYGNGVSSVIAGKLLERLGCEITEVNEEIDGSFPNHLPAPGEEKAQKQLIDAMSDEDLGIIFDGDGDRAGFIIDDEYIGEDKVLAIFSSEILEKNKGKVVHDLRASKLVKETINNYDGIATESRVGHTFISDKIYSNSNVVFAGELSGHYYFPAVNVPWDDGLFSAAYMCSIESKTDLSERIDSMPKYPVSPELRIDCPNKIKEEVVREIEKEFEDRETSNLDGVKIMFENGWALVRPSNTEPKMSVRCEADDEEALDEILEKVETAVRNIIGELK